MRNKLCVLAGILFAFIAGALWAQSDSDYQAWMKTIAATNGSLGKNLAAKDAAASTADAQKLEEVFKQVEDFWQKRNAADAVGFATKAGAVASMVAKDVAAGDFDKATADSKTIGANCGGCHMAHREKTDAGFKIK